LPCSARSILGALYIVRVAVRFGRGEPEGVAALENAGKMSDSQLTSIARLDDRLASLKVRL
jgi:hypothetical protein